MRRPRGRTRLRARTARGRAPAAGAERGAALPRLAVPAERGPRPMCRWGRVSALCPSQLTPYFLPLVDTASLSLFPATEFMVAFPAECLNVPPALHPKGLPTRKGPPRRRGLPWPSSQGFLMGGGDRSKWTPEAIAPICRKGRSRWFILPSNTASPHPLLPPPAARSLFTVTSR